MSNSFLSIVGKTDPATVQVLEAVHQTATNLGIPYVVVGATARDLVLHYGYGAPVQRATADVDFAIEVPDWQAFERLTQRLREQGFTPTDRPHRFNSPNDAVVDIIPFGPLASEKEMIAWPPDETVVMDVTGFADAAAAADRVRIKG